MILFSLIGFMMLHLLIRAMEETFHSKSLIVLIEFIECPVPNITFLLDIDVSEGFARKINDKKDRIESSGNTFFENVRKGYLELSKNNERIKLLDAKKQIGDLHQEIVSLVEKYL